MAELKQNALELAKNIKLLARRAFITIHYTAYKYFCFLAE